MLGLPLADRRRGPAARRRRAGGPALEFALVAPLLITMLLGVFDAVRALTMWRRATTAAQCVAEIATSLVTLASDGTYQLTSAQAFTASTAIYAIMPALKTGRDGSAFAVTVSGVVFTNTPTGCTSACTSSVASTAWSVVASYDTGETPASLALLRRPCGTLSQTLPTAAQSRTTLPTAGLTSSSSLVVADVVYVFKPIFLRFVIGSVTIRRSAFWPPRVGSATAYVYYDVANQTTDPNICAGYV